MPTTPLGTSYEETKPPTFSYNRDGVSAKRTLKVAWGDIEKIAYEFFPPGAVTSGGNLTPKTHHFPGRPYLVISNLEITPFDEEYPDTEDAYGVATCPSGATVEISYETFPFNESGGTTDNPENADGELIFSHALQVGGEYLQLPAKGLRWEDDPADQNNQEEDLVAAKLVPTIEHVLTAYRVPDLPLDIIVSKIGTVNEGWDRMFNAPAQTLLFLGANATRKITTNGVESWELEYRFSQRVIWEGNNHYGWNHFFRTRDGAWVKLKTKQGNNVYSVSDFTNLFYVNAEAEFSSSQS